MIHLLTLAAVVLCSMGCGASFMGMYRDYLDEKERPKTLEEGIAKLTDTPGSPNACCATDCIRANGGEVSVLRTPKGCTPKITIQVRG